MEPCACKAGFTAMTLRCLLHRRSIITGTDRVSGSWYGKPLPLEGPEFHIRNGRPRHRAESY
ncbi:hypothetical protein K431DRAFT_284537 [Polychaeton citri CBS 116435]|uniref:Uncharacterized protein n=1 Tax=Polychaeton citri CBS 116435 TaxID=1314669 RepID=A0A9P4QBH6_9PEZI|nr:hypothetical protein K431DRAFT_284537 [Polychaeton citri CBS 116435]